MKTGLIILDDLLSGGLTKGEMVTFAGRVISENQPKTNLMADFFRQQIKEGKPILMATIER